MLDFFLRLVTYVFAIGVVGCLIMLPIVVWRFVSVLFEKDGPADEEMEVQAAD